LPPPQDPQAIYRSLVVTFGQQGADQLVQQLGQVSQSFDKTGKQATRASKLVGGFGKVASGTVRGITALGVGVSSTALAMRSLGIDLVSSQRQLFEFNKGLLASRVLFAKYGESVSQTRARIVALKDEYEFTRSELLSLQKQFQTGFTYLPIQQMTGYMRFLADATGESSAEMAALDQIFQGISQKMPIFEQMLRGNKEMLEGTGRDILDTMFVTGQLGTAEYKQGSGAISAANITNRSRDPGQQTMRDQLESVRRIVTVGEDIQIKMAEQMQPAINLISQTLEQNRDAAVKTAAITGNILRVVSVLGGFGAAGGAMRILRGGIGARGTSSLGRTASVMGRRRLRQLSPHTARASSTAGRVGGTALRTAGGAAMTYMSTNVGTLGVGALSAGTYGGGAAGVAAVGVTIAGAFAAAVGGFKVGTMIYEEFVLGLSGLKETMNSQSETSFQQKSGQANRLRGMVPNEELDALIKKQEKIRDLELEINSDQTDRMGGMGSTFANLFTDPLERSADAMSDQHKQMNRLRREASETLTELKDQVKAEEAAYKAEQERQGAIERIRAAMQLVTFEVERQEALLDSQIGAYQTLIQLQSMGGGGSINLGFGYEPGQQAALLDDLDRSISSRHGAIAALQNLNEIINQRQEGDGRDGARPPVEQLDAIKEALQQAADSGSGISEKMLDNITEGLAEGISAREVMIQILQLQTEIGQKEVQRNDIVSSVSQKYAGLEEQARAAEGVLANQVQLSQNLAMGVGASASMIFRQVQAIEAVIQAIQAQRREMELSYQAEIQMLEASGKIEEAKRLEFQMTTELLEMDGKITSERTKQAGLSKTIRDGWVSAISSMMTGEGMFTKIVVDQNTRLGGMMAATNNRTVGVRTGFGGRGFENSQRYVPGGIIGDNSGLTDEWLQSMTESNPLASLFTQASGALDPAEVSKAVMSWMSETGRHLGTGAAGAEGSRYGTSEFLDGSDRPSGSISRTSTGSPDSISRTPIDPPTSSSGTASLIERATASAVDTYRVRIELIPSDKRQIVEELKKEIYRSFRMITESAAHKVVDDLNMRN